MAEKKPDKAYPSQFDKVREITDKLEAGIQALFESEAFKKGLNSGFQLVGDLLDFVELGRKRLIGLLFRHEISPFRPWESEAGSSSNPAADPKPKPGRPQPFQ